MVLGGRTRSDTVWIGNVRQGGVWGGAGAGKKRVWDRVGTDRNAG